MTTTINYESGISVIQVAPMSGVFASQQYIDDKQAFIKKVINFWYVRRGNTVPLSGDQHRRAAEKLYEFYLDYRKAAQSNSLRRLGGRVLLHLYRSGSLSLARQELDLLVSPEGASQ